MTTTEIRKANRSSRSAGAVGGGQTLVTKMFLRLYDPASFTGAVLDFGAGKRATQTRILREKGFRVQAYDFGSNVVDEIHNKYALVTCWDVVLASNVLNVQCTRKMLRATLTQIACCVSEASGVAIVNYPAAPRYLPELSACQMEKLLLEYFHTVRRLGGPPTAPIWQCYGPKR